MHGTIYEHHNGKLSRIVDRAGAVQAALAWDGDQLVRLEVPGAVVDGARFDDPLLGEAHAIEGLTGTKTAMTALGWARPTRIPAVAAPAKIPPSAGAAILNVIAVLAQRARVTALRYAGPYPTAQLWRALGRSFVTSGQEDEFTAGALERALQRSLTEIAIDFHPAPHERIAIARGHVELRSTLERAVIDSVAYQPDGSPARLVGGRAEVWFGDSRWAHVATFSSAGELLDGPHPLPRCTSDVIGREFPAPLRDAIAEMVADAVTPPLGGGARTLIATRSLRWADLGARAARATNDGFEIHAALWDRIAPLGMVRLALALAEALVPVVTHAVVEAMVAAAGAGAR
ncbi:MAG: hypothetical protein AB7R00_02650 [Kofleriaceae bacterium]